MNILGITCYVHDSAACLIKDGRVIANVEEERLNRVKHTQVFPQRAIEYVLQAGDLTIRDIDSIAFNWNPLKALVSECLKFLCVSPPVYFKMLKYNRPPKHFKTILASFLLRAAVRKQIGTGFRGKVLWVDHHLAHSASAYYLSSFANADILVIDGFGEFCATTCLQAQGHTIRRRWWVNALDSLGIIYLNMTRYLGFELFQEGKTMALASLGRDTRRELFKKMIQLRPDGRYRVDKKYLAWWKLASGTLDPELGLPRKPGEALTQEHMDLAASLQKRVTEAVLALVKAASQATGNSELCLAGGLFLNCAINAAVERSGCYEKYFVPPFTSDTGGAIGAALYAAFASGNEKYVPGAQPFSPFLGPDYTDEEIAAALREKKISYSRVGNPGVIAARALAGGKVIGWLQGRIESGPRALGGRSILASPLDGHIQEYLNSRIKKREYFQPFAPVVTAQAALKYFDIASPIPESAYCMLLTVTVKKAYRSRLPGITHVDGSSRVQVLRPEWNPALYELLLEFERLTGFAVVINTSFNRHEPIVCSPADAIKTFASSELDMLVMGGYIVERDGASAQA